MSLFEQTQYDADILFYAMFPAARDAAYNAAPERSVYDHPRPVDCPSVHEAPQFLRYDIPNDQDTSSTSMSESFRGPSQELSYPRLHAAYSESLHPSHRHHQTQLSYYSPPRPASFFYIFLFEQFSRSLLDQKRGSLYHDST
jgi:hypothetical protein